METIITKEKFLAYFQVQKSGITNMWDVPKVVELSNDILNEEDCLDIMKNYSKYKKQFVEEVE